MRIHLLERFEKIPISLKLKTAVATATLCFGLGVFPVSCQGSDSFDGTAITLNYGKQQSKAWREQRSAAIELLQKQGFLKIEIDQGGNEYLSLPWIPNRKLLYKSLSVKRRLINEVCAGAFGEIAKDLALYPVDTIKTRRQATIKRENANNSTGGLSIYDTKETETDDETQSEGRESLSMHFRRLYAGFPVVVLSSIPQGGLFFLVRMGLVEIFAAKFPELPVIVSATIPIVVGVAAYWCIRTPSEVIKTQVQTGQVPSIRAKINELFGSSSGPDNNKIQNLWNRYPVMLAVDIPFQLINFSLYSALSEHLAEIGVLGGSAINQLFRLTPHQNVQLQQVVELLGRQETVMRYYLRYGGGGRYLSIRCLEDQNSRKGKATAGTAAADCIPCAAY